MLLHNPATSKAQVLLRLMALVGGVIRQKTPCTGLPCSAGEVLSCDPWSRLCLTPDPPCHGRDSSDSLLCSLEF